MKVAKKRESSDPLPVPSKKMKMTSIQTKMPSKLSKKKKLIEKSSPESNNTSHIMVAEVCIKKNLQNLMSQLNSSVMTKLIKQGYSTL